MTAKADIHQSLDTLEICFEGCANITEKHIDLYADSEEYGISDATIRNWKKLNTQVTGRLTTRANKRLSKKRILPMEYISNKNNVAYVQNILDYIDENHIDIISAIFSLGINLLKKSNIDQKKHVENVLSEYANLAIIEELTTADLPSDEFDILGVIYQSYLREGKKNVIGSYYTSPKIACNMVKDFELSNGELFLDPCCGSGVFLLMVNANDPSQLYGVDNDSVAVLISKINLLLKYRDKEFIPQVYCLDFLMGHSLIQQHFIFKKTFNYIVTNPPWGAVNNYGNICAITSKETFSYFFVKAFEQLKENGMIRFLFPESILNVKVHKDIRKFILERTGLSGITAYDDMFSGVTTKYIDIECRKGTVNDKFNVYSGSQKRCVEIKAVNETENFVFNLLSDDDLAIVRIVKERGKYSLRNSIWALGIVTGDNKRKLSSMCLEGMEKIYTGKEIQPYLLLSAKNYILYNRADLQQVAKDETYRAPEKLVYKFISNRLVFAYDNSASLFLNSANILIPNIPSMDSKTVMAFLNSSLFQFLYIKLFGETKILKGNLIELPFPEISEHENKYLSSLVDMVLNGDKLKQEVIDSYIFSVYGLTQKQIQYVRRMINGKADQGTGN